MYTCRKCKDKFSNLAPSMVKNQDYICSPCHKKHNTWRYKLKGVYGIFSGETCLYIGESKQVNRRISDHKYGIKNPTGKKQSSLWINLSRHKNIEFRILEVTVNHKEQEQVWIEYMTPLYN